MSLKFPIEQTYQLWYNAQYGVLARFNKCILMCIVAYRW